jgi:hypothetical protein
MIVLWGPRSTGKTVLLANLYWRSSGLNPDWGIFPGQTSEEEQEELRKFSEQIQRRNEFPAPTKWVESEEQRISYGFRHKQTGREFSFESRDRGGFRFEGKMDAIALNGLYEAEGIVLLIDGDRGEEKEIDVTQALMQMNVRLFKETGKRVDGRPLAVCLSKADQYATTPEEYRKLSQHSEKFVRERLSPQLLDDFDKFYSDVKYFPVSSVGLELSYGSIRKSVFWDEKLQPRVTGRGMPVNLLEPFVWIFERLEAAQGVR